MGSLPVLLRLIAASLRGQMRYPGSALMLTLGQFLATGIEVVAVWALFHRFGSVQGWQLGEVALFYGLVNIMFAVADALGRGFDVRGHDPVAVRRNGLRRVVGRVRLVVFAHRRKGLSPAPIRRRCRSSHL